MKTSSGEFILFTHKHEAAAPLQHGDLQQRQVSQLSAATERTQTVKGASPETSSEALVDLAFAVVWEYWLVGLSWFCWDVDELVEPQVTLPVLGARFVSVDLILGRHGSDVGLLVATIR